MPPPSPKHQACSNRSVAMTYTTKQCINDGNQLRDVDTVLLCVVNARAILIPNKVMDTNATVDAISIAKISRFVNPSASPRPDGFKIMTSADDYLALRVGLRQHVHRSSYKARKLSTLSLYKTCEYVELSHSICTFVSSASLWMAFLYYMPSN